MRRTVVEHFLAGTIDKVVAVLGGRDLKEPRCCLDILNGHLAQSRVTNQFLIDEGPDCIELFVRRDSRINAVQLPQVDLFDAQIAQALMHLLQ